MNKDVCVILSTYNGSEYLNEQIESILNQKKVDIHLFIRDDGSKDSTKKILSQYEPHIEWYIGENVGPADSFFDALKKSGEYTYYAYADQDDIWDDNKITEALSFLETEDDSMPLLYYSNSSKIGPNGEIYNEEQKDVGITSLCNGLVNSNAQGSTMVFNRVLKNILVANKPNFSELHLLHDAWTHKSCLACGGIVLFDKNSHMKYRIHGGNVVGTINVNRNIFQKIIEVINTFKICNKFYYSNIANELIKMYGNFMTKEDYSMVNMLSNYRCNVKFRWKLLTSNIIFPKGKIMAVAFKIWILLGIA